jgi:ankyrin repeat protein
MSQNQGVLVDNIKLLCCSEVPPRDLYNPKLKPIQNYQKDLLWAINSSSTIRWNKQEVENALEKGADINQPCPPFGMLPLQVALRLNLEQVVDYILNLPTINVNAADGYTATALHTAVEKIYTNRFIVPLIKKGCNINHRMLDGNTPLHEAVRSGNLEAVKILITHGADVTLRTEFNPINEFDTDPDFVTHNEIKMFTPFEIAEAYNHTDIIKFLIQ